jgi:serine/threonine-protein kinase RsbW
MPAVPLPGAVQSLTLINDLDELRRMSAWLTQTATACGLSQERVAELEVCANEAVTNIISYAYDSPGQRNISLCLSCGDDSVNLSIEDDGSPFNPLAAAQPEAPASLEQAGIGGLGIKLIRRMMKDCRYQRRDGKNIFSFTA